MDADGLKEVCRACLCTDRAMCSLLESLVPKFDSPPNSVVDVWKIFTKILTVDEDRCADKICMECLNEIQRMYGFILKCEKSEDVLKKMKTVFAEENIKSGNKMFSNIPQIKTENFEWNDEENEGDEEDKDWGEFEEIIDTNFDRQVASSSQHTLTVKHENDNSGNELFSHLDYENNVTKDEVPATHDIKQEPELDICLESYEFESEHIASTEIVKCPACPYECRIRESMKKHIIENHMEGQTCKLCNKEFQCGAIEHCSKHINEGSTEVVLETTNTECHKCTMCSKIFATKSELSKHLTVHSVSRAFKCESCPRTFVQKWNLTQHLKCHTGERPFKCESCPRTFVDKWNLTQHLKFHTEERPYKCETCSKTFVEEWNLEQHLKFHTDERQFKCELCSKTFVHKGSFTRHLLCHKRRIPNKCEICPKMFIHKSDLKMHLKCHKAETAFKCEFCSKTFTKKFHLTIHLRCHERERPFKCEICMKTFMKKGELTVHTIQERHLADAKFVRRSLYENVT